MKLRNPSNVFFARQAPRHADYRFAITIWQEGTCIIPVIRAHPALTRKSPRSAKSRGTDCLRTTVRTAVFLSISPECHQACTPNPRGGGAYRWRLLHAAPLQLRSTAAAIRTVWQLGSVTVTPLPDAFWTGCSRGGWTASDRALGTSRQYGRETWRMSIRISRLPKLSQHSSTPTATGTVPTRPIQPHQAATRGRTRRHRERPVQRSPDAASAAVLGCRISVTIGESPFCRLTVTSPACSKSSRDR